MIARTGPARREPPRSLYVHFPFCAHRCHYCDFSVARATTVPVSEWLDAVDADLAEWFACAGWNGRPPLDTIFVGGGTPSLLGGEGMRRLSELLARRFEWESGDVEWTAEANPRSLDAGTCAGWREAGVTRISIGVQSFADGPLRWLGRLHDAAEAEAAVRLARDSGFRDVNIDLIFGLPEDVPRDWSMEIRAAVATGATHVSTYGLTAEPRTPLGRRVELGRVRMADEGRYEAEYLAAVRWLTRAGFLPYEVSNFARPGYECRHNWQYWKGVPYLGIGPSAHSYLPPFRVWNVFRWDAYLDVRRAGGSFRGGLERVDGDAGRLERLWLGLRTREGITVGPERLRPLIDTWRAAGWVRREQDESGEVVRLTPAGWLRLDEIVAVLERRMETWERRPEAAAAIRCGTPIRSARSGS